MFRGLKSGPHSNDMITPSKSSANTNKTIRSEATATVDWIECRRMRGEAFFFCPSASPEQSDTRSTVSHFQQLLPNIYTTEPDHQHAQHKKIMPTVVDAKKNLIDIRCHHWILSMRASASLAPIWQIESRVCLWSYFRLQNHTSPIDMTDTSLLCNPIHGDGGNGGSTYAVRWTPKPK